MSTFILINIRLLNMVKSGSISSCTPTCPLNRVVLYKINITKYNVSTPSDRFGFQTLRASKKI